MRDYRTVNRPGGDVLIADLPTEEIAWILNLAPDQFDTGCRSAGHNPVHVRQRLHLEVFIRQHGLRT